MTIIIMTEILILIARITSLIFVIIIVIVIVISSSSIIIIMLMLLMMMMVLLIIQRGRRPRAGPFSPHRASASDIFGRIFRGPVGAPFIFTAQPRVPQEFAACGL